MATLKERYIKLLDLQALQGEPGYLREVYRAKGQRLRLCDGEMATTILGKEEKGPNSSDQCEKFGRYRDLYSTIYYLLEETNVPSFVASDHLHIYHDGCPVKFYWIEKGSTVVKEAVIGRNLAAGEHLQLLVPGGSLKWAVALDDGVNERCSLLSECVMPGFCFDDRNKPTKEDLKSKYPRQWDKIKLGFPV